jgi:sodium transport system permease protein
MTRAPAPPGSWTALDAALAFLLALATFLLVAVLTGGGLGGLIAAQVAGLLVVPLAVTRARGVPLAALGLVRPPARALVGATLIGAGIWCVSLWVTAGWAQLVGQDPSATADLEAIIRATPLAAIILLSLVPAVCEELATRGLLLLGLRRRLGSRLAIAIATATFVALHGSILQIAPMALLGVLLGVTAVRTGSVLPGMLIHGLNNLIALLMITGNAAPLVHAFESAPLPVLVISVALVLVGTSLAWRPARTPS